MPFTKWFDFLAGRSGAGDKRSAPKAERPTPQEMQIASIRLDELAAAAILGEIGGGRPDKENRTSSWWGGNFLGAQNEDVPVCNRTGRKMHPVLQIRIDELPEIPPRFEEFALLNIWMDLQSDALWCAQNGDGFTIRTYTDLKDLVPLGAGFRESTELPSFPIFWRETILEQPSWDDLIVDIPINVARATQDDWFSKSQYVSDRYYELRNKYSVKIGGWPSWIQGSNWPKDAQFFLQVDSTNKGKLYLGDAGSFYIFRTADGWEMRADCF